MKTRKTLIAIAALVLATGAWATPGNNGGGNGGCGLGQQTNGCGGETPAPAPSTVHNGGNAAANAGAIAGAAALAAGGAASIDSSINNTVNSTSLQSVANVNDVRNSNSLTATGGAGGAGGEGGAGGHSNSGGNVITVSQEAQERNPVSTAYAPSIAPTATCMGSTSAGAQGVSFGVSFGSTWTDENCQRLEQVRVVSTVLGDSRTAAQMMCAVPAYAEAREAMGMPCTSAKTAAAQPQYTDPYVRARLGLAALGAEQ